MDKEKKETSQPKPPEVVIFRPYEVFGKHDYFQANSMISMNPGPEANKLLNAYHKELEDLMRKYKIIQSVAHILAKL